MYKYNVLYETAFVLYDTHYMAFQRKFVSIVDCFLYRRQFSFPHFLGGNITGSDNENLKKIIYSFEIKRMF